MRYYSITIQDQNGNNVIPSSLQGAGFQSITSLLPDGSGNTNVAALDIELDINSLPSGVADTASYVRIYGLGLQDLGTSFSLGMGAGANFPSHTMTVRAGMAQGLPLANPLQQGVLATGNIFQAFGNWLGNDMTVDIYFMPSLGTTLQPKNYTFNWIKGTKLSNAIQNTLSQALPNYTANIQIQERVAQYTETGVYSTWAAFSSYIQGMTGATSPVKMSLQNNNIVNVWDGTVAQSGVKMINFQDLIGQVTWIGPFQVQAKLVMRGDLNVNDVVQFPKGIQQVTAAALLKISDASNFTGNFRIYQINHWGRYRQADAMSWNTTIWCNWLATQQQADAAVAASGSSWIAAPSGG